MIQIKFPDGIEKREITRELDLSSFEKSFRNLCERRHPSEAWRMFIYLTAHEYADMAGNRNKRLYDEYWNIYDSLTNEEYTNMLEMLSIFLLEMRKNPFQDWLGTKYTELGLADTKTKSQFFTPSTLSDLMARLTIGSKEQLEKEIEEKGYITIGDDCIGSGSLQLAALKYIDSLGIDYRKHVLVFGRDNSELALLQCYIQLSIAGAAAWLSLGDSLIDTREYTIGTPQLIEDVWCMRALRNMAEKANKKAPQEQATA